jgi:C4-dicarboxylate-specific signal transduction histidine kinase
MAGFWNFRVTSERVVEQMQRKITQLTRENRDLTATVADRDATIAEDGQTARAIREQTEAIAHAGRMAAFGPGWVCSKCGGASV